MITAIVCVAVGTAHADPETLFTEGLALLNKGDYTHGCPKFEQAYEDSQKPGIEANLARCADHDGDLPKAWRLYTSAATKWEGDPRAAQMRELARGVARRATWVVVGVPDPALPGLSVEINGHEVTPAREIRELVMPGEIALTAKADGKVTWNRSVAGKAGDSVVVEVMLADAPGDAPIDDDRTAPVTVTRTERRRSRVYLSIGLGVAAVAALTTSYFVAKSASDEYDDILANPMYCMGNNCTPQGQRLVDDAQRKASIGTAIAIGGGAFAVGAVVVFLTAPRDPIVTPTVSSTGAGISLFARF